MDHVSVQRSLTLSQWHLAQQRHFAALEMSDMPVSNRYISYHESLL